MSLRILIFWPSSDSIGNDAFHLLSPLIQIRRLANIEFFRVVTSDIGWKSHAYMNATVRIRLRCPYPTWLSLIEVDKMDCDLWHKHIL